MRDSSSRRSRRPPPDGRRPVPFIPILIGVILLGLVIGAGLSLLGKRNEPQSVTVRTATPQPTLPPVTPAPSEKPTAEPTTAVEKTPSAAAVTQAPRDTPQPSEAPLETPSAPARKRAAPVRTAGATSPALPVLAPVVPAHPGGAVATARAIAVEARRTALASASTAATNAAASSDDADSEFAKLAASVVRQYIAAVARGDVAGAYGALGQSVPDNDVNLPELGVIDGSTRIRHVEARGLGDAAAVNVDMQGRGGSFFGQYTVHKTPSGAAVIVQHSIVKP